MYELLVITFTFGVAIFTFLSMLEIPVWKLIFTRSWQEVSEESIRFVHRNLRFMTSKLPPANGLVIFSAMTLMILQCAANNWSWQSNLLLAIYIVGLLVIVVIFQNPKTVLSIRTHDSATSSVEALSKDLRYVGRDHHLGLLLNLTALVYQLIQIWS